MITDLRGQDRWLAQSTAFRGTVDVSDNPVRLGSTYREPTPQGVRHGEVIEFEPRAPQSVGVLNDIRVRVFGFSFRAVSSTVTWDPPSTCAFESVRPSWPVTTRITEQFRRLDGRTEHVIDYEVIARGAVGSVVAPVFCRLMQRNRHQYQERLRIALVG